MQFLIINTAGEFGQEKRVLPAWYHVFPCKAALFNLARSGGVMRWSVQLLFVWLPLLPFKGSACA